MSAKLIKSGENLNFSAFMPEEAPDAAPPERGVVTAFSPPSMAMVAIAYQPETKVSREESAPSFAEPVEIPDAQKKLEAATAEAEALIQEAQKRAAEIEQAARDRGLAEAQAQIMAHVQAEANLAAEDLRARLTATLEELAQLRAHIAMQAERDLVRLALEIAKKVVHREVRVDQEIALTLVRVALERLHSRAGVTIRLHPDDYGYVWSCRERLGTESSLEIVEDRSVGRGGCIVKTEMSEIDARIEQQFSEIEQNFLSA
jgi:flagellar assembly protein FliH